MYICRASRLGDIDALLALTDNAGIGVVNLPHSREKAAALLHHSAEAFASRRLAEEWGKYLFLLENCQSGKIEGCCVIENQARESASTHCYQLISEPLASNRLKPEKSFTLLSPSPYNHAEVEICSLYLDRNCRTKGLGKLLSLCRFLFIACFPERFGAAAFAEIRGYCEAGDISPFWSAVGERLFEISFVEAIQLIRDDLGAMSNLRPSHPIYVNLLPKKAQEAVGRPHPRSRAALEMLIKEGFSREGAVDLMDGGPKISAPLAEIRVIKESRVAVVSAIHQSVKNRTAALICNSKADFRSCYGDLSPLPDSSVSICQESAASLQVAIGNTIRYIRA